MTVLQLSTPFLPSDPYRQTATQNDRNLPVNCHAEVRRGIPTALAKTATFLAGR